MTNEEFQRLVLEKLGNLEDGQNRLETRQSSLEEGLVKLETRQTNLEEGFARLETRQSSLEEGLARLETRQSSLEEKLDAVIEQTAILTEFRQEIKDELDHIKISVSRIEIATADNWSDIARLKAAK